MKKKLAGGLGVAILACASALAVATPASADPGVCGVRHAYIPADQAGGRLTYVVRNQCSATYNFEVFLPSAGKSSEGGCRTVAGGDYGYYSSFVADPNWQVRLC
ncbi:hypothetical protein [Amycolatopsis lexingtonensis]|uniref:hypothetical protein n=1 Tax=Amycolatopsis lexingtonensis TaxID=218822 RepID=UPI003F70210B